MPTSGIESDISRSAEALVSEEGGFPAQEQEPPGETAAMVPTPDHGEESYIGTGRLRGMRALITGGDSGIGRAIAIAFAREGADAALSYMGDEQVDAEETARWVRNAGRTVALLPGDIRDRSVCEALPRRAISELGGLEILVNNAGFQMARTRGIEEMDPDDIDRTFKTNLYALFWLTKAAIAHMTKGSCIINNTSIQAYEPSTSLLDYAATKAAINNFTVNLAGELGPRGIRVNAVAPGPIWTPLQPATQDGNHLRGFGSDTPLGRSGQPGEVAPAFVFLASPADASYVSGTVLGVTGGKPVF
jgi:NAD(P)-dependent dehydrogenase (short-subunit alcohol dehydrogenase family)